MVKGKALYLQGNFESAMVLCHRALHIGFGSKIEEMKVRQIINRATEVVNNSLGTKQAENVFLLIPKMFKRYDFNSILIYLYMYNKNMSFTIQTYRSLLQFNSF